MSYTPLNADTEILLKQLKQNLISDRPNCAEFQITITEYTIDVLVIHKEPEVISII